MDNSKARCILKEQQHKYWLLKEGNMIKWPNGKSFAFTIVDDTDMTTIQNGPIIYELLNELGLRTTKTVWPIKGERIPEIGGSTCEDPNYLRWVMKLHEMGFEIALHNVTYHTSLRHEIVFGLKRYKEYFGEIPRIQINHAGCLDSIYWGESRLTGANRWAYNVLTRFQNKGKFQGHVENSDMFWGDHCLSGIEYVRNFVYSDINTLKMCPQMPYHDEERPFVNYWFASTEGPNCSSFCKAIAEPNIDRLEDEGGACIMYTHLGSPGFLINGKPNPEFMRLLRRLSSRQGWFVPVSTVLDHIIKQRGAYTITPKERRRLEVRWLLEKAFVTGGTS